MKLIAILLLFAAAGPVRRGNVFEMLLDDGRAELEWVSAVSFRLTRLERFDRSRVPASTDLVKVACSHEPTLVRCRTEHIEIEIDRRGRGLRVRRVNGQPVLESHGTSAAVQPGERFYGLGVRSTANLDLSGSHVEADGGLLISSAGYGEYRPGHCAYDLTEPRRTASCGNELYFYYGPTPKEILEEHAAIGGTEGKTAWVVAPGAGSRSWKDLRESLYALQHAALSGVPLPPLDINGYEGEAAARASQIAALVPVVHAATPHIPQFRERLLPYLETYAWEARDRGIPTIRPLAIQFPEDATAVARTDEFMSGDEMLVAPLLEPGGKRSVYLPRGIWTDLRTGAVHKGRQEITIEAPPDWTPVFVRNGMLLPLSGKPLELHYFPRLGAEFFLWEPDLDYISQFHASPTVDLL
ncbi:MAG TPA: hypothetical protein VN428_06405, partial [Bryobacteraceae bacterium]|nr:hypothetical protein [Bryobacteraceae bacterium]